MLPVNNLNQQIPRFIISFCRNLQQHRVIPEMLSFNKIDAVLHAIEFALCSIKLSTNLRFKQGCEPSRFSASFDLCTMTSLTSGPLYGCFITGVPDLYPAWGLATYSRRPFLQPIAHWLILGLVEKVKNE